MPAARVTLGLALACLAACGAPRPSSAPSLGPPLQSALGIDAPSEASTGPARLVAPTRDLVARFEHRPSDRSSLQAQPIIVAGIAVDARAHGPAVAARQTTVVLQSVGARPAPADRRVALPAYGRLTWAAFSPDGARLALGLARGDSTELWTIERDGRCARVDGVRLNAAWGAPCDWRDSAVLVCRLVADLISAAGEPTQAAEAQSADDEGRRRDEAIFEDVMMAHVALVNVPSRDVVRLGSRAVIDRIRVAPGGHLMLVSSVVPPYPVPLSRDAFRRRLLVTDFTGRVIEEIEVPPAAPGEVTRGGRDHQWHPLAPATLVWVETIGHDGAAFRERVMAHDAPFHGSPRELARTEYPCDRVAWGRDGTLFVTEHDERHGRLRTWAVNEDGTRRKLWDRRDEPYEHPWTPRDNVE